MRRRNAKGSDLTWAVIVAENPDKYRHTMTFRLAVTALHKANRPHPESGCPFCAERMSGVLSRISTKTFPNEYVLPEKKTNRVVSK